jgi:hypothetical protein
MAKEPLKDLKESHPLIYNRVLDYQFKQSGTRSDSFPAHMCHVWTSTIEGATFWDKVLNEVDGDLEKFYELYPREKYPQGRITDSLGDDAEKPQSLAQENPKQPTVSESFDDPDCIYDGDYVKGSDDNSEEKNWTTKTLFFRGQTKLGLFITEDTDGNIKTFKHIEKVIIGKDHLKAIEIMEKYVPESKKSHPASEVFKVKAGILVEMLKEMFNSK